MERIDRYMHSIALERPIGSLTVCQFRNRIDQKISDNIHWSAEAVKLANQVKGHQNASLID